MPNDLIDRVCADPVFQLDRAEIEAVLKPINFTGRSVEQVEGDGNPLVGGIVQGPFKPLGAGGKGGGERVYHHITG